MKLTIGEKIKELRKRDGRKQEDLANALGVTNQAVSRWEKDGSYPDMEMIPAIANYFGVTIDELFGYENGREKQVDELVSRLSAMNKLNNGENVNIDECLHLARTALTWSLHSTTRKAQNGSPLPKLKRHLVRIYHHSLHHISTVDLIKSAVEIFSFKKP